MKAEGKKLYKENSAACSEIKEATHYAMMKTKPALSLTSYYNLLDTILHVQFEWLYYH